MIGFVLIMTQFFSNVTAFVLKLDGVGHKVSPQSTDPVPLYSMYSKLQNVNIGFLDSPETHCLHSAACCTKKNIYLNQKLGLAIFFHQLNYCGHKFRWKNPSSIQPILVIHHFTKSLQSIGKHGFQEGINTQTHNTQTDITTYRLKRPRDLFSESAVKH